MKRKQVRICIFIILISFAVVFTGCKGDNSAEVVSVTVTPAGSSLSQSVGFVQFVATATYGDNSTGDISLDVEWKSNNLLAVSATDLLFEALAPVWQFYALLVPLLFRQPTSSILLQVHQRNL